MTKIERLNRQINDAFKEKLRDVLAEKWPGLLVETYFDLIGSMRMITKPLNRKKFLQAQYDFIAAYEEGYFDAKEQVRR